ncbi:hypothetical protein [Streptomyces fragilis]|uniref:hypothetical protein n=1 Tax=Streptomyces fragilis TaxID=67301 RepID=UPI0024DE4E08|nr:hypothetical protein [Streptomyces fragilis]
MTLLSPRPPRRCRRSRPATRAAARYCTTDVRLARTPRTADAMPRPLTPTAPQAWRCLLYTSRCV